MTTEALESDVLLARSGDETAFRRVVERSANTVCSIALAIVRNLDASEDVAQEVFLAAWSGLGNLRNPASFLPWLRQITRNQALAWRRRHAAEVSDAVALETAMDARPTPADTLLANEKARVMREVLDALEDDAREVLLLYYRENSSTRQVSLLLGISEEAVRQRLSRSRAVVREDVLRRFAGVALQTAPSVAFVSVVAAAITVSAHSAAAATIGTTTAAAGGALSIVGGVFGWAGVLLGLRTLEPAFDEREARALRHFRNAVLLMMTVGGITVAMNTEPALRFFLALQVLYFGVGLLYAGWLPRILKRRYEAMQRENPELAKKARRKWLWTLIGRAGGLALLGAMIMAVCVSV